MDERERHAAGTQKRRQVLGHEWVDRSVKNETPFNKEFLDLITRYAWGEIMTRPRIDDAIRRLIVLASTIALGRWEEYRLHLRAGLTEGKMWPDVVDELILRLAI